MCSPNHHHNGLMAIYALGAHDLHVGGHIVSMITSFVRFEHSVCRGPLM